MEIKFWDFTNKKYADNQYRYMTNKTGDVFSHDGYCQDSMMYINLKKERYIIVHFYLKGERVA